MLLAHVPEPVWPGVAGEWALEPAPALALAVAGFAYWAGCRVAARAHPTRAVPANVRWSFWAGWALVAAALLSPIGTYAEALLSVHMVQHLLLTLVAAPLLLMGRPLTVMALSAPGSRRRALRGAGRAPAVRVLGHPLAAWLLFAATGWAVHFSPLFDAALESHPVHGVEHGLFLATAMAFWRPVVGRPRIRRHRLSHPLRLLYLAVAMPQNTFLALAVMSSRSVLYDQYALLDRGWGPSVLADQRQGGGIMWVAGDLALLVSVLLVVAAWARRDSQAAEEDAGAGAELREAAAGRPPSPRTAG